MTAGSPKSLPETTVGEKTPLKHDPKSITMDVAKQSHTSVCVIYFKGQRGRHAHDHPSPETGSVFALIEEQTFVTGSEKEFSETRDA